MDTKKRLGDDVTFLGELAARIAATWKLPYAEVVQELTKAAGLMRDRETLEQVRTICLAWGRVDQTDLLSPSSDQVLEKIAEVLRGR